jgi:uncharacterized membrane protein YjjP (DUF1212 family)
MSPAHLKLVQLHQKLTQEISKPLINKCKRWAAWAVMFSWGVACIVFGVVFGSTPDFLLAIREGFSVFWVALGAATIAATFGIANWLGKSERGDA